MSHRNLNVLSVFLLLAGCGGGDFSTAGLETGGNGPEGTGGAVEADAGVAGASQGTGGVTGVTGGQAAVTGGSAGTGGASGGMAGGGAGGQLAGSGGDPGATGGTATGGQQPATGGAGGAGTVCTVPVVTPENLPQAFVWGSWVGEYGTTCVTCQQSPCTTCSSVAWWPVTQSADGLTITAKAVASQCAPVAINVGPCTSDLSLSSCTIWDVAYVTGTYTFQLKPKPDKTGYTTVFRQADSTSGSIDDSQGLGSCAHQYANSTGVASGSVNLALRDTLAATEWPCGQ